MALSIAEEIMNMINHIIIVVATGMASYWRVDQIISHKQSLCIFSLGNIAIWTPSGIDSLFWTASNKYKQLIAS